ncbi:MAG: hypothetical protein II877_08055, partial [Synergistaceae bacterium]|nr:hypothetical protein [Synergistaceae bacterium]
MKKFSATVYLFTLALLAFAVMGSGCGGSGGGDVQINNQTQTQSAQSRRMIISSPALTRGETYRLYRGNTVGVSGTTAKYYAAPVSSNSENIVMNLEYANAVSEDLPFIITDSDGVNVLFSYNPKGTTETDTTTAYGSVIRNGGASQQLRYTNLNLSASSIELDDTDAID